MKNDQVLGTTPTVEARDVRKHFGAVIALAGVSLALYPSEVLCLLGDNGAGKSTVIKILSGVFPPTSGQIYMDGTEVSFPGPRHALDRGIATVHQDLAMIPLMSVMRNFFMGREPVRPWGPLRVFDVEYAEQVTQEEMARIGIDVRDPHQAVGTLSGGERQCLAIARAVHFGARVLILDEPTSALGVHQTATVLEAIDQLRSRGLCVIFITHNVRQAFAIGDKFTVLNRGRTLGNWAKGDIALDELETAMAGGKALREISEELGRAV